MAVDRPEGTRPPGVLPAAGWHCLRPFLGPTPTHGPFKPWRLILSLPLFCTTHLRRGCWPLAEPKVLRWREKALGCRPRRVVPISFEECSPRRDGLR